MTSLDLGVAFTKIASTYSGIFDGCGKDGSCTIYVPESIYKSSSSVRLGGTSATTINYTRGTINPKYKMVWTKVSSALETVSGSTNLKVVLKVKGDNTSYSTGELKQTEISVYVNGTKTEVGLGVGPGTNTSDGRQ